MNHLDFDVSVEQGHLRSKKMLTKKAAIYAYLEQDRLIQFKKISVMNSRPPEEVCVNLMSKHFSSVCDMARHPREFNIKQWREKITDLRNYTHLLEALVEETLDE